MLGHNASISKLRRTESIQIFSDHNRIKLEIHYKKKFGKLTNMQNLTSKSSTGQKNKSKGKLENSWDE